MKAAKWNIASVFYMLLIWTGIVIIAFGVVAWILDYRLIAVVFVLLSIGIMLVARMSLGPSFYETKEVELDISSVKHYMEGIAETRGKFYLSLYSDGTFIYTTLKFDRVLFRELYEMVRHMQSEMVRVFITNESEGSEISYKEMSKLLKDRHKQYEHVLAMDEVLSVTLVTPSVKVKYPQSISAS